MAFNTLAARRIVPQAPTPAEKALEERNRAYKQYRRAVLSEREELFRSEPFGEVLRKFAATLNHFGPDAEERMVKFISEHCYCWLRNAEDKYRIEALRLIGERCMRNAIRRGKPPLNCPLPGQPDDTYRLCKRELGL